MNGVRGFDALLVPMRGSCKISRVTCKLQRRRLQADLQPEAGSRSPALIRHCLSRFRMHSTAELTLPSATRSPASLVDYLVILARHPPAQC